ncbi:MAG: gluconokinase [Planctomycetota bacterium]|jgi:carbohydrate kinase (thermoresistant glucokinase family)
MIVVVMGICSCGKTLIGQKLAQQLGLAFYDADDYHPKENVEKMTKQIPLNDKDRIPWLREMARQMPKWESKGGAVLACSALKESYRQILSSGGNVRFVYLKGTKDIILQRMQNRKEHFMPTTLIESQMATLEEPEDAISVDIENSPSVIIRTVINELNEEKGKNC